jgi:hypothetical protein
MVLSALRVLLINLIAYGAAPVVIAERRLKPLGRKIYRRWCIISAIVVSVILMIFFRDCYGLLTTLLFAFLAYKSGLRILASRGMLSKNDTIK